MRFFCIHYNRYTGYYLFFFVNNYLLDINIYIKRFEILILTRKSKQILLLISEIFY